MIAAASALIAGTASAETIAQGNGEASVMLGDKKLNIFTYRPTTCEPRRLLVVFHGLNRDAGPYRDHARTLADRLCAVVVAPEFDTQRFPTSMYQLGGSTVELVAPLVAWARRAAAQPDMPYILIGHSAGGQFLGRVAAYTIFQLKFNVEYRSHNCMRVHIYISYLRIKRSFIMHRNFN